MSKSLTERLALRAQKNLPSSRVPNRACFLAYRKEIEDALLAGWSKLSVWNLLCEEGKIAFSYKTFRRYISELTDTEGRATASPTKVPSVSKPSTTTGFTFNAVPNLKELI